MSTRVRQKVKTDTPINLFDLRSFRSSLKSHPLWVTLYLLLILSTCQLLPSLSTCHTCSPFVYWFYSCLFIPLVYLFLLSLCLLASFVYLFLLLCTRFFCCILVLFLSSIFPSSRLLAVSPFVYLLFLISSTCCFYSRILAVPILVYLLFLFLST